MHRFSFIIRYNNKQWHVRPTPICCVVRVTGLLIKHLVRDGILPPEEGDKQLQICREHIRSVRQRLKDQRKGYKHTREVGRVRNLTPVQRELYQRTNKPTLIPKCPPETPDKLRRAFRAYNYNRIQSGKTIVEYDVWFLMKERKGGT